MSSRWLDVHVRGAVAHRLGEDAVDDLDDRRVVGDDLGLGRCVDVAPPRALDRLERLDEFVDAAEGAVVAVDRPADVARSAR